jgi:hypothetical protein
MMSLPHLKRFNWGAVYGYGECTTSLLRVVLNNRNITHVFLYGHSRLDDSSFDCPNHNITQLLINGSPLKNPVLHHLKRYSALSVLRIVDSDIKAICAKEINAIPALRRAIFQEQIVRTINLHSLRPDVEVGGYADGPELSDSFGSI